MSGRRLRFVVYCLLSSLLATSAFGGGAGFAGRVIDGTADEPVRRAHVQLSGLEGGFDRVSAPTGEDGRFEFDDLEAGLYRVRVETDDGVFPVALPIEIRDGDVATATVLLAPAGVWDDPLWASIIVAGSAVAIGFLLNELTSDDGTLASPFAP